MPNVLQIGAGGVGCVAAQKIAALPFVDRLYLASRRIGSCQRVAALVPDGRIECREVDADDVQALRALIAETKPDIVVNTALPYQDLTIMDACLAEGVSYLDTANYEPREVAHFEYSWQWAYHQRFSDRGITAILGCGFDPGVTGVFTAYAAKHHFEQLTELDIVDCNAGNHHKPFATNFNPEINIREITQRGRYYSQGQWLSVDPLSVHREIRYPEVGGRESYLLYHEELESLVKNYPTLQRARFWMTFGEQYLTYLRVIQDIGMARIDEVDYGGVKIVPLQFLKAVLPNPQDLGENYEGQTSIGCRMAGLDPEGKRRSYSIWNNCSHEAAFRETGCQAVSYTTGVPCALGTEMYLRGLWREPGVHNVEEFNPDPFLARLPEVGLPWAERFDSDDDKIGD